LQSLAKNRDGNIAMTFALLTPLLFIAAGVGIDFQAWLAQKAELQEAADTLALRGARELLLENSSEATIESMLAATATKQFGPTLGSFEMTPAVNTTDDQVNVRIAQPSKQSFFLSQFIPHEDPIVVDATAQAKGVTNVCVIALEESKADAISGATAAKLDAKKCAILSNSRSSTGINVKSLAKIAASVICSAGGAAGGSLNYSPMPILDCPQYDDPLAERTPPSVGGCDHINTQLAPSASAVTMASTLAGGGGSGSSGGGSGSKTSSTTATTSVASIDGAVSGTLPNYERVDISPGVYCGGLRAIGTVDVHAAPGVYVMKDGPLRLDAGARLYGKNVGVYFDGDASIFEFRTNSIVNLTAPKTGLMAGLLFWESASAPENRTHSILSENARELLGTIYLPRGRLAINTKTPIADASAYTAIVVKNLAMDGSPQLVLNTDYNATDIPTPEGVGPTGGAVYLRN